MVKKSIGRLFAMLLCIAVIFSFGAAAYADDNSVKEYNIRVSAGEDKVYKVTENVSMHFNSGPHYIEKTIPMDGMKVENVSSSTHESVLEMGMDGYVIRIGNDDVTMRGEETFSFTYTVRAYDEQGGDDMFDFVLVPKGFESEIGNFKAHINLPKEFQESAVKLVTDGGDSIGNVVKIEKNNTAIDITASGITADSGIKCQIELPRNYWKDTASYDYYKWILLGIIGFVPVLVFLFWLAAGRDPKRSKGEYHFPPEGMTPIELGYIIDGQIDQQDAASMLIYFAQKGYLRIDEYAKGKIIITKVMDIPKDEKPFARTLFDGLFQNRSRMKIEELDREFGAVYMDARKQLKHYYNTGGRHLFTRKSRFLRSLSVIMSMLPATAAVCAAAVYKMSLREIAAAAPVILLILIGGFMVTRAFDRKFVWDRGKRMKRYFIGGIMLAAANTGAAWYAAQVFGLDYAIALVASACVTQIFIVLLKARTVNSVRWLDQILGLKTFMKGNDVNTARILNTNNPGYYYEMLSYSYALDVMGKWTKLFSRIDTGKPEWFEGYGADQEKTPELTGEVDESAPQPEVKQGFLSRMFGQEKEKKDPMQFDINSFYQILDAELGRLTDGITEKLDN